MDMNATNNAWVFRLGEDVRLNGFKLSVSTDCSLISGIQKGDAIVLSAERERASFIVGFGRVFRKRYKLGTAVIYLDGLVSLDPAVSVINLDLLSPAPPISIIRIDWSSLENALKLSCKIEWASFPVLNGQNNKEQAYVREHCCKMLSIDDLLGPANGPKEEIIGMSVRDRYLVGKLAPMTAGSAGIEGTQSQDDADDPEDDQEFQTYEGRHQPGQEFSAAKGGKDT
jgi:hypothetical protein